MPKPQSQPSPVGRRRNTRRLVRFYRLPQARSRCSAHPIQSLINTLPLPASSLLLPFSPNLRSQLLHHRSHTPHLQPKHLIIAICLDVESLVLDAISIRPLFFPPSQHSFVCELDPSHASCELEFLSFQPLHEDDLQTRIKIITKSRRYYSVESARSAIDRFSSVPSVVRSSRPTTSL